MPKLQPTYYPQQRRSSRTSCLGNRLLLPSHRPYEPSSHSRPPSATSLRLQRSMNDMLELMLRLEDKVISTSTATTITKARPAPPSALGDILDESVLTEDSIEVAAKGGAMVGQTRAKEEVVVTYEIEEEPTHQGKEAGGLLQGVGGTDMPCPGKTQGPDAGACQVREGGAVGG